MFDQAAGRDTAALITEQLPVVETVLGSATALPSFIEFHSGVRKRKERIALLQEDESVERLNSCVAGMDERPISMEDLIDHETVVEFTPQPRTIMRDASAG